MGGRPGDLRECRLQECVCVCARVHTNALAGLVCRTSVRVCPEDLGDLQDGQAGLLWVGRSLR